MFCTYCKLIFNQRKSLTMKQPRNKQFLIVSTESFAKIYFAKILYHIGYKILSYIYLKTFYYVVASFVSHRLSTQLINLLPIFLYRITVFVPLDGQSTEMTKFGANQLIGWCEWSDGIVRELSSGKLWLFKQSQSTQRGRAWICDKTWVLSSDYFNLNGEIE